MPSKNMLPKGKRRHSVRAEYRAQRTLLEEEKAARRARLEAAGLDPDAPENALGDAPDALDTAEWAPEPEPLPGAIITTGARGSKVAEETQEFPRYPGLHTRLQEMQAEAAAHTAAEAPPIQVLDDLEPEDGVRSFHAEPAAAGLRLDAYLAKALPDVSRSRVTLLIDAGQVRVDNQPAKGKLKLRGGELIEVEGEPTPPPLRAEPEDIPLTIVYEDDDLAVIDKPAGMTVHAGAGSPEANRGTLVNALLFHFGKELSAAGDPLRPGIVHRLDKDTSGLILVAKNDPTHRKLSALFAERRLRKMYLALVHGWLRQDEGTVALPISRDAQRRIRMTTRLPGGRHAVSHYRVLERLDTPFGRFSFLEVEIETGRTHQIRVHMQALGHPVVGDALYGAPARLVAQPAALKAGKPARAGKKAAARAALEAPMDELGRNFLHAAELDFTHPVTGEPLELRAPLPAQLTALLERLRAVAYPASSPETPE